LLPTEARRNIAEPCYISSRARQASHKTIGQDGPGSKALLKRLTEVAAEHAPHEYRVLDVERLAQAELH